MDRGKPGSKLHVLSDAAGLPLFGYRRLSPRYERYPYAYLAFLTLAAAMTCHKRHLKLTM
ncbi:hypothetical protein J2S55_003162 [Streptosporangium brasiliense]|uniref:Transposase IS4-like domain-containing protein n=1 Tax=Streptosporangium brasiliense TaxID=47480 RepID=A0ABT9R3U7_9ACTN|nr:hypothetical protein [Streptosporangium brasiliense]